MRRQIYQNKDLFFSLKKTGCTQRKRKYENIVHKYSIEEELHICVFVLIHKKKNIED